MRVRACVHHAPTQRCTAHTRLLAAPSAAALWKCVYRSGGVKKKGGGVVEYAKLFYFGCVLFERILQ